jgi:hypothetical protein
MTEPRPDPAHPAVHSTPQCSMVPHMVTGFSLLCSRCEALLQAGKLAL